MPDAVASADCCAAAEAASAAKAASAFFACCAAALGRDFDLVPFDCDWKTGNMRYYKNILQYDKLNLYL